MIEIAFGYHLTLVIVDWEALHTIVNKSMARTPKSPEVPACGKILGFTLLLGTLWCITQVILRA